MKLLIPFMAMLLAACASDPGPPLPSSEDFEMWRQVFEEERVAETKDKTLWMYSAGSFALFAIGLGIIAFSPLRRLSGLVFVAGGAVGMASHDEQDPCFRHERCPGADGSLGRDGGDRCWRGHPGTRRPSGAGRGGSQRVGATGGRDAHR